MKIIFNLPLNTWYCQIYDELKRKYEVILPDNYKDIKNSKILVDVDSLEECVKENSNFDFIFGFEGNIDDLIKWEIKKIKMPLIIFHTNSVDRPYRGKITAVAKLWFVEYYAKSLLEKFQKKNLIYEGMAANSYLFHPIETKKIFDVSFVGQHYGERPYWVNLITDFSKNKDLKAYFPVAHGSKMYLTFKEINEFYNQSKINISFAPRDDPGRRVNLRTFEICMSGNFQLMQYSPCVEEYFEIDKEIVCWENKKELFEKILYYLENKDERVKIAKKGYEKAIKKHTWSVRFEKIYSLLKNEKQINLNKYVVKIDDILIKQERINIENLIKKNIDIVEFIVRQNGFKKKNVKKKNILKLRDKESFVYYKPNLIDFYFINFYGKTITIIKKIPVNSEINLKDWDDLKKKLYLTENLDYSVPQFGILTNGYDWVIKDFKKNKWLKEIPSKKVVKYRSNFIFYFIFRILKVLNYFNSYISSYIFSRLISKNKFMEIKKFLFKKLAKQH